MINLHERMLPTSAGVEPATSWSPVGRRIQMSHRGRPLMSENCVIGVTKTIFSCLATVKKSDVNLSLTLVGLIFTGIHKFWCFTDVATFVKQIEFVNTSES